MVRPLRIEYPGALYHVVARGNKHQDIYFDSKDRNKFLNWIGDAVEVHNLIIHAYCLMDNHYHLLVETPEGNLSKAMRDINGNYTQWFNREHGHVGHLFQGRYKAFVVEKDIYLHEVTRYILLNPVRAGIVEHAGQWKWSSYNQTISSNNTLNWLHTDWILSFFSEEKKKAQKYFQKYIDDIGDKNPFEDTKHGFILGSPQFIHWLWETQTNESENLIEHSREQRMVFRPSLKDLFLDINSKEERNRVIKFARFRCGYSAVKIAEHVGLHPSVVERISRDKYNKKVSSKT